AIDEQRLQFQPAIWSTGSSLTQSVTQAWFAGVHCDVGGGYPADDGGVSLANIPLRWMAGLAAAQGAVFKPGFLPATASASDALATLHESRTGAYRIFPAHIRAIEVTASLASSVEVRMRNAGSGYAPSNLHSTGGQLASTYEIVNMDAPSGGLGGQEEGTQSAV
ncbi:MAG: phospholipase effector Tle1 domain-containing protein, partial [Acidobacteriota bacterium]